MDLSIKISSHEQHQKMGARRSSGRLLSLISPILFVALYSCSSTTAIAQCYPLNPTSDELGYRYRSNRCEGLYQSNVSLEGNLHVISLLEGQLDFILSPSVVLEVSPLIDLKATVNVRAVPISLKTYYRMDARIQQKEVLLWPVADVLHRKKISSDNLGVYGWYGADDDRTFVPLRVVPKGEGSRQREIVLRVRSSTPINRDVNWRWSSFTQNGCSDYTKWQNAKSDLRNVVSINLASVNANYFCVEIKARETNGDWLPSLIARIRRS